MAQSIVVVALSELSVVRVGPESTVVVNKHWLRPYTGIDLIANRCLNLIRPHKLAVTTIADSYQP